MQLDTAPEDSAKPSIDNDFSIDDVSLNSPICAAPDHWYSGGPASEKAETGWYFLYGKLASLSKLAELLNVEQPSKLNVQTASVNGHGLVKYGNTSLELTHEDDRSITHGIAIWVESSIQARELQRYATDAFTLQACSINLEKYSKRAVPGQTFVPKHGLSLKPPVST
ncbi:hypothetical protein FQN49_001282 [Arthroderma sp. PD_2]|nr:hypothetical protein FQN49_001282 [Arthroderma sp. PD_2]